MNSVKESAWQISKHTIAKQNRQKRGRKRARKERDFQRKKCETKHTPKHKKFHHSDLTLENNLVRT